MLERDALMGTFTPVILDINYMALLDPVSEERVLILLDNIQIQVQFHYNHMLFLGGNILKIHIEFGCCMIYIISL